MTRDILFYTFLLGVSVGEFIMFGVYGMMGEMLLLGAIAVSLNVAINYMKKYDNETKMGGKSTKIHQRRTY